jgi:hypothetical protein
MARLDLRRKTPARQRTLACIAAATTAINYLTPAHATTVTSTWTGTTSSAWTTASNWIPSKSYPNNGNAGVSDYAAVIPAVTTPDLSPTVNSNITLDSLTLNSAASLAIQAGNTLQLTTSFANSGTVTVGSTVDTTASVLSLGSFTLSGAGLIALDNPLAAITGSNFTSGATITGEGTISNNFTNDGTINANMTTTVGFTPGMGTLSLTNGSITNNNIIEATNSGVLLIATTINQGSAGEIIAGGAGQVSLANCTISGGTLFGTPLTTVSGDSTNLNGVTNAGFLFVSTGSTLTVNASFTNADVILGGGGIIDGTVNCTGAIIADEVGQTLVVNGAVTGAGAIGAADGAALRLAPNTGASTISTIDTAPNGVIDLTNNHLFIDYGSSADPISSIAALLKSGYNNGAWNGPGIDSSTAAANSASYGLGYADSNDPGNPAGLSSGTIEIKYTLLGDANLSGVVDGTDFGILAANFNKGVSRWDQGDFNYDGTVDGTDFSDLAANFNKGAAGADAVAALDAFAAAHGLLADVPEPTSAVLLLIASMGLLPRRRQTPKLPI